MIWFGAVKMVWFGVVRLVWSGVVKMIWFGVVKLVWFGVVKLVCFILNGLVLMTWFDLLGIYRLVFYTRTCLGYFLWNMFGLVFPEQVWFGFSGTGLVWSPWNRFDLVSLELFDLVFPVLLWFPWKLVPCNKFVLVSLELVWFGFPESSLVWFPLNRFGLASY